jgi:S-DNA-T family DNA segregation ATPase FtsK/SpoIIIE
MTGAGGEMNESNAVFAEMVAAVMSAVAVLVLFMWRRPKLLAVILLSTALWWALRIPGLLVGLLGVGVALLAWRLAHPASFRRLVSGPAAQARRQRRYRGMWPSLMAVHRLSWAPHPKTAAWQGSSYWKLFTPKPPIPKLEKIELGVWVDRLCVRMLPGQTPADWEGAAEGIGHAVGARDARVRLRRPGRLSIELFYDDPLASMIPALPVPGAVALGAVAVGMREDGQPWVVRVIGTHLLVAGATGSGKGSVVWSYVRGLASAIAAGLVEVWAIDPKGGMELGPGRALFTRFAADDFEGMADLLDEAVTVMRARAQRLAGVTRTHQPTPEEPLIVVLVDELANLTAYLPDRKLRERISQAVSLLLTQGRAVGVVVVAALQDPRKDVVTFRNLFPTRVALRLDEPSQIDMVLGDGARDQGARCDQIPESLPGVGYVRVDGVREPVRVRAAWVSDGDIATMTANWPGPVPGVNRAAG